MPSSSAKTRSSKSAEKSSTTAEEGAPPSSGENVGTEEKVPATIIKAPKGTPFPRANENETPPNNDNLYETSFLKDYVSRRAEPEDVVEIKQFLTEDDYSFFKFEDLNMLFETCCFSIILSDIIETDRIVAAAFFDDKPIDPGLETYAKTWKSTPELQKMIPINTIYLHLFTRSPEVQTNILITEVVACTFSTCSLIEYIIVECPSLRVKGAFAFCNAVKQLEINLSGTKKKSILIYDKGRMFPALKVREGRENDLDDLSPILPVTQKVLMKEFGKAYLTDVIALSDKNNQSAVAEWNSEAVGIISGTTDINYQMLARFFHLEPFHGLFKPHPKDKVHPYCYDIQNVAEIPIQEVFQEAKQAMRALRGRSRKQRPDDPIPYTVEAQRDDNLVEYESDESGQNILEEKHRVGHQFGSSVSNDILEYGLRPPSPESALTAQQSARIENIRDITERLRAGQGKSMGHVEDDEEEEEEEEDDDVDWRRASENVLKRSQAEDGHKPIVEIKKPAPPKKSVADEKYDPTALNLLDFITEFIVDEGEEEETEDEGGGGDVEFISEPKKVDSDSSDYDNDNNDSGSETLDPDSGSSTSLTGELGDGSSPTIVETLQLQPLPLEFTPPITKDEERGGEFGGGEGDRETEEIKKPPEIKSKLKKKKPSEKEAEEIVVEEVAEARLTGPERKGRMTRGAMSLAPNAQRDRLQTRGVSLAPNAQKKFAKSNMLHGTGRSIFQSEGALMSNVDMTFFQHKVEIQQRWSDDTLYLGRTGADKTFDEKMELMKKVWEVWQYMKQEKLTFETARIYLSNTEINALDVADVLTKGNLLKFLTLLLPDEKMFPFDRFLKPEQSEYFGLPNALLIKLFNVEKKFNLRSMDLLKEIFRFFPNREYLVVTIPQGQGCKEPAWLDHFVRAVPRLDCNYNNELFILHKAYLVSKLKVRRARISDIPKITRLVETLKNKDKILSDFKASVCCKENYVFVVEVKNHPNVPIVGLAIVSDDPQSQSYHVNYQLYNHTYYIMHKQTDHAYVHHLILYPIFQRFGRTFLKEMLRIMDKTCLYQRMYHPSIKNEISDHQTLLNNLDDWMPVMPRKRVHYNFLNLSGDSYDMERLPPLYAINYSDPYAVVYFGKKYSFEQKVNINTRIVFVGASETNLACISKMLCSSFRAYKRLTLIDTHGIPGQLAPNRARDEFFAARKGGSSSSFNSQSEWGQRMGLTNWVNVVVGTATKIERDTKFVIVNKNRKVPYDILVLSPGRQFQRIDCPEPEINDPNFISFKQKTKHHTLKDQPDTRFTFKRESSKPKNVFTVNTEVEAEIALDFIKNYLPFMKRKKFLIFGGGLLCYACVRALLLFGIQPNRIVLITPPNNEVEWEAKSGYILTDAVRIPMEKELKRHGVHLVENYEFNDWETCPISGLVKRCYFHSPSETESTISFPTFALFSYRHCRINDDLVSALAESYILYQEGIIIDENFITNDPDIYAAGPATTYKRILLASHQDHLYYQSEEIGQKLAELIIGRTGSEGGGPAEVQTLEVLRFKRPFVRSIILLGGWHYMYMRSPGAPYHLRCYDPNGKCEEACECTTEIVTGSIDMGEDGQQKYFKLRLDDQSRVVGIECMSKKPFSASNFMGLYGQHEVLLNKMMERLEKGETTDLFDHFCQPWFGAFCVDHWENFVDELQELYKTHDVGDGRKIGDFITDYIASIDNPDTVQEDPNIIRNIWDNSGLKDQVEFKFLSFLKFHKYSLPMYARNDYAEDLLEERSTSALYIPRILKY